MVSTQLPGIQNEDILLSIFSFLPVLDLARCAAVCKQWHEVVTGSTHLWKGKRYDSMYGQRLSAQMRGVLFALPLLHKVEVENAPYCYVNFSYPCLSLTVSRISDLEAMRDWPKVRCTYLSVHVNFAKYLFSSHSPIDFSVLQKLNITKLTGDWILLVRCTRAERVISDALQLCPNLRELSVFIQSLSADYLDALEGMSRLRTLKIQCNRLEKLVFLRHCSEMLEELELEGCSKVPSAAYAELRCLGNLRRLRLHSCQVEEGDLEIAMPGLKSLVSLQLSHCFISDLSFLRHCGQLREVSIGGSVYMLTYRLPIGLRHLPASVRSLCLISSDTTPDELSEALPCLSSLDQLSLSCDELDRLDFLRGCRQLRHLCLEYSSCPNRSELLTLRHMSQLETLEMPAKREDLAFLSRVIPSLPQLDTLKVRYTSNVDYVLLNYPRLLSLSVFDKYGNMCDMSKFKFGSFDPRICGGKYMCKFVRKIV